VLFLLMFWVLTAEGLCEPGTCDHGTLTTIEFLLGLSGAVVGIVGLRLIGWEEQHPDEQLPSPWSVEDHD
jgi:hypothetical protein